MKNILFCALFFISALCVAEIIEEEVLVKEIFSTMINPKMEVECSDGTESIYSNQYNYHVGNILDMKLTLSSNNSPELIKNKKFVYRQETDHTCDTYMDFLYSEITFESKVDHSITVYKYGEKSLKIESIDIKVPIGFEGPLNFSFKQTVE